jgi:hypothetical protein
MLLRHTARSLEALLIYLLELKLRLFYNSLVPFWPSDFVVHSVMPATLLVSPYLALKFWISSPGGDLTLQTSSENVKFPTHNSYLSSTRFAKKNCLFFS